MKSLKLELANCYGIRKLDVVLNYDGESTVGIYAPNGAMKSSLAATFQDVAEGKDSRDRIFADRVTTRVIQDETATDVPAVGVLVVRPYDEASPSGDASAALLLNATLRQEYETLHADVNAARSSLLGALKATSKSKRPVDREVSTAFAETADEFDAVIRNLKAELEGWEPVFKEVPYDLLQDDRVSAFLANGEFRRALDGYVKKYNELLAASKYFKKGGFNYYEAANLAKALKSSGFFVAKHTVALHSDEQNEELTSDAQLQELINAEKAKISEDAALRAKFQELEKEIQRNAQLREFETFLHSNVELIPELVDMAAFRRKLWLSYLKANHDLCLDFLQKLDQAAARSSEIEEEAKQQHTLWEEVIDIFNDRFMVPFHLQIANKSQVVIGKEVPRLGFVFKEDQDHRVVERDQLLTALSTGERRAFHVLNMLFEIHARRVAGQTTLLVIDDIADSFDYKNKYAIVQYLSDLAEDAHFKLLILTHNFDFFRTIISRGLVSRRNSFMVTKTNASVELVQAEGVRNIFQLVWKPRFFAENKRKICCIPFMRNLIEFTKGEGDSDYLRLTSLLHWKSDSNQISVADLDGIYNRLFGTAGQSSDDGAKVVDLIDAEAAICLQAADGLNFENKVVLSIAIRLKAEQFMTAKINNAPLVASITSNQTPELFKLYRAQFPSEALNIAVLNRVLLMTPENIHLNSFMYEPILDMSDLHLRRLYGEVQRLQ
ncbi:phage infection protein [Mitsuaria sp. GD03876]|uniref:phage infection protein n=1 Tax=Mitsuaria sp. GD03876 TaxID=2975399 RepID=UPI00244A3E3C|nr:phage infection protein [Mitsuaria sp. GD03876]MDH0865614.1 phage infection protein [Mitsuaria sp. GD03876]